MKKGKNEAPVDPGNYNRIIIVGSSGSGKSCFARSLGAATGLPVIHLDMEYWQPDWVGTPKEQWVEKQKKLLSGDRWIIDGDYSGTLELRFQRAELVIFLDINRLVCLFSAAGRMGKKRADLPAELTEPGLFTKDGLEFAKWIWDYPKTGRKKVLKLHEKYPDTPFLQVTSRRQLKGYLN